MNRNLTIFQAAIDTLEEEYRLLERPIGAQLTNFATRKQAIAAMLADEELTLEQARTIRSLAARNQNRLSAVSKGTAEALRSLREFKSGRMSALHYASNGKRSALDEENVNVVRRA